MQSERDSHPQNRGETYCENYFVVVVDDDDDDCDCGCNDNGYDNNGLFQFHKLVSSKMPSVFDSIYGNSIT